MINKKKCSCPKLDREVKRLADKFTRVIRYNDAHKFYEGFLPEIEKNIMFAAKSKAKLLATLDEAAALMVQKLYLLYKEKPSAKLLPMRKAKLVISAPGESFLPTNVRIARKFGPFVKKVAPPVKKEEAKPCIKAKCKPCKKADDKGRKCKKCCCSKAKPKGK